MNRLDSSSPLTAERLRNAGRDAQRHAAVSAAALVARVADLGQAVVGQALELLNQGALDDVPRDQLAALVEELDEIAWSIQEAEEGNASDDYMAAFGRARAAAAVLFAADTDAETAALEAVYEAGSVAFDDAAVEAAVDHALNLHGA